MQERKLNQIYTTLLKEMGQQDWWPAKTRFEVIVGAILTQNTNWQNVKLVIKDLEKRDLLKPKPLHNMSPEELAPLLKRSGYFNQKAKKLKAFLDYFKTYDLDLDKMMREDQDKLRQELLDVWGVGPETADAILLYALDKPVFVMDAYTKRIFSRMGLIDKNIDYEGLRSLFEDNLKPDVQHFQQFHALIDEHGKNICKSKPICSKCPLKDLCEFPNKL